MYMVPFKRGLTQPAVGFSMAPLLAESGSGGNGAAFS